MKKALVIGSTLILIVVVSFCGLITYVYWTNRTLDQTLATDLSISNEWLEITPTPPLTVQRQIQEVDLLIEGFKHDRNAGLPFKIKLPDGRTIKPDIELYDESGNKFEFHHSGHTLSTRDIVVYTAKTNLSNNVRYTRLRIRSDQPFTCERLFWRDRNLK